MRTKKEKVSVAFTLDEPEMIVTVGSLSCLLLIIYVSFILEGESEDFEEEEEEDEEDVVAEEDDDEDDSADDEVSEVFVQSVSAKSVNFFVFLLVFLYSD